MGDADRFRFFLLGAGLDGWLRGCGVDMTAGFDISDKPKRMSDESKLRLFPQCVSLGGFDCRTNTNLETLSIFLYFHT